MMKLFGRMCVASKTGKLLALTVLTLGKSNNFYLSKQIIKYWSPISFNLRSADYILSFSQSFSTLMQAQSS